MRHPIRRGLLLVAALAIPASIATLAIESPAFAGVKITCLQLSGTLSGTVTASGCTGGNTGGASQPAPTSTLIAGGTIHWVSGGSLTFSAPTQTATNAKKCPGYVKGAASEPTAAKVSAGVTADTGDGIKVPGKLKGSVCLSQSGNITALKAFKIS